MVLFMSQHCIPSNNIALEVLVNVSIGDRAFTFVSYSRTVNYLISANSRHNVNHTLVLILKHSKDLIKAFSVLHFLSVSLGFLVLFLTVGIHVSCEDYQIMCWCILRLFLYEISSLL